MGGQLAYFDNAATTYPKPDVVYDFADSFYRGFGGNMGRGGNALAMAAGDVARQAKDNLRTLYNCPAHEVVFTASATDALNRILFGTGLMEGDHVYLSPFEHNAVTRPLNHLAKTRDVTLHVLPFNTVTFLPEMDSIEAEFRKCPPKLVVLTHASNVCGTIVPVEEIFKLAKRFSAITVVDMSQTAGLLNLDLEGPEVDFAVFAGHKTLYAPFGIGGFFCKRGARLEPVFFGGNGIDSVKQELPDSIVEMEEIGSQNTYAIAGLKASTEWLAEQGMSSLRSKENASCDRLLAMLDDSGANIIGREMSSPRVGIVSATFDGFSPDEIEMLLGRYGVAVRSGIQCAPYAHEFLRTLPMGTVRFSVSALTSEQELDILVGALRIISEG